jgi:hypothetical protein
MRAVLLCTLLAAAMPGVAAESAAEPGSPRYALRSTPTIEPVASASTSGRYTLRARLAPEASAGELREGANFTLIGRFAKGAVICSAGDAIFRNGFEQP